MHAVMYAKQEITPKRGFTLIELLVVIAIIGILSSVVFASLNIARDRGKEGAVRSNLRNMLPEAELNFISTGNYQDIVNCHTTGPFNKFTHVTGAIIRCYSHTDPGDVYQRWGAAGRLDSDTLEAWAVDSQGVVVWDDHDTNASGNPGSQLMNWDTAMAACATAGGKMPSAEQLKSLYDTYGVNPTPGFSAGNYWSSTESPISSASAYRVDMNGGGFVFANDKSLGRFVRCVR